MTDKWYFESNVLFSDLKIGYLIKEELYTCKTSFQQIHICNTERFGNILFLDGITQTTEKDEFIYHEMIVHVPLLTHPAPRKVLIIGGGDGGTLREVLRHPIKKGVMVEIDEEVIKACKKYLPTLNKGAFKDKRAEIIIEDGVKFVAERENEFDVIIVDSSDPIGPAEELFGEKFYKNVSRALTKQGIAVYQTGLSFLQTDILKKTIKLNKKYFRYVTPFFAAIPTYWGGEYSFTLASKKINPIKITFTNLNKKVEKLRLKTKYYNPSIHKAAFAAPNYILYQF